MRKAGGIEYDILNPTILSHIEVMKSDSILEKANLSHILSLDLQGICDPICKIHNLGHKSSS
jgi:hypothetical protein